MIPSFKHGVVASSRKKLISISGNIDFTAGEFSFNDISVGENQSAYTNTITVTHSGILAISSNNGSEGGGSILKNGVSQPAYYTEAYAISAIPGNAVPWFYSGYYSIISVSTNDTLQFYFAGDGSPFAVSATITIRNATFSGTVIDTFTYNKGGCFLTTAVVRYMGLLDDGPELTAMRSLREYYKDVPGYTEIIQEYYLNSQEIINAIDSLADSSIEYNYIYNTVISVMNHVNSEEWQQAHNLYMAMYNDLKNRYLG